MSDLPDDQPFNELIAELSAWNNGDGIDPRDWIGCVGNYELAIGYSLIFWPRFVCFGDYVFRDGSFSAASVQGFEEATNGDRRAVEAVVNHVHIADIHCNVDDPGEAQLRYLGRVLRDIYATKLKADFPDRAFEVVFNDESGLDPEDYELTFWQRVG